MKIAIIGTKGIPANYGGFETFAFQLAKHLANMSYDVTVVNEKDNYAGSFEFPVQILYSKYKKSKNPIYYYRESLKLVCKSHDIVLVCGVGGSFFYPFFRSNAILVTNVDGLEHLRGKYSFLQRKVVYFLQTFAAMFSNYLIADSKEVENYWKNRFEIKTKKICAIAYGADVPAIFDSSILNEIKLDPKSYFLVVARLVPENNLQMIIDAFNSYSGIKSLVIVGDENDNPFSRKISKYGNKNIRFIGSLYVKEKLDSLRKNCFAYIHGHSVGGTNPALLEAMVCECACICHDNVFNREVTNNSQLYFKSSKQLLDCINSLENNSKQLSEISSKSFLRVKEKYSWDRIASLYEELFKGILEKKTK